MSLSKEEWARRRARYKSDDEWNARWLRWGEMDEIGKGVVVMVILGLIATVGKWFF